MGEEHFQEHFKTKLIKESSSFCIESLLSNKSCGDKKIELATSPSNVLTSGEKTFNQFKMQLIWSVV